MKYGDFDGSPRLLALKAHANPLVVIVCFGEPRSWSCIVGSLVSTADRSDLSWNTPLLAMTSNLLAMASNPIAMEILVLVNKDLGDS